LKDEEKQEGRRNTCKNKTKPQEILGNQSKKQTIEETTMNYYAIAREYDTTVQSLDIGYGNRFQKQGKAYFSYLLKNRPEFKSWVEINYPQAI